MLKKLIILLFIFGLTSCGKTSEEAVRDALISAELALNYNRCDDAIEGLEAVGRQPENSRYIKTLATAYACRAGYSTLQFFANDIGKTADPAPLGGMTLYSTSRTTVTFPLTEDSSFRDMQTAIDLLLYAGGIPVSKNPSITERAKYFTAAQAGEINALLAYLVMVQMGKLMKVYGDTDSAGLKGGGSLSNTCFADYTGGGINPAITAYLATSSTGSCTNAATTPNSQLASTVTTLRKRLCEGVILMNTFLNVLPGVITAAGGTTLGSLDAIDDQIEGYKNQLLAIDSTYAPTITVLSQYKCENDPDITLDTLNSFYAIFYESLVQ
jgi:hypothetical protein